MVASICLCLRPALTQSFNTLNSLSPYAFLNCFLILLRSARQSSFILVLDYSLIWRSELIHISARLFTYMEIGSINRRCKSEASYSYTVFIAFDTCSFLHFFLDKEALLQVLTSPTQQSTRFKLSFCKNKSPQGLWVIFQQNCLTLPAVMVRGPKE